MGCGCEDDKKGKVIYTMDDENSLNVILNSPNIGQRYIYGGVSKIRYGYYGLGEMIPGVLKEDIRARPNWFLCAKCGSKLTVTKDDVYCDRCRNPNTLVDVQTLVGAVKEVSPGPKAPAPPKKIRVELAAEMYAAPPVVLTPKKENVPDPFDIPIDEVDFGNKVNAHRKKILRDNGIVTFADARNAGYDKLVAIKGISVAIADTILKTDPRRHILG